MTPMTSSKHPTKSKTQFLLERLLTDWRHSFEEDDADVEVFRPKNFDFPPAFGRDGFDLNKNGEYISKEIGPADEPIEVKGTWSIVTPVRIRVELPDRESATYELYLDSNGRLLRRDISASPLDGLLSSEWTATLGENPSQPDELIVRGVLTFRSAGYSASLKSHSPQGINPRILLLDLVVNDPAGPAAQVITEVEVEFRTINASITDVTVLPLGEQIPVTINA